MKTFSHYLLIGIGVLLLGWGTAQTVGCLGDADNIGIAGLSLLPIAFVGTSIGLALKPPERVTLRTGLIYAIFGFAALAASQAIPCIRITVLMLLGWLIVLIGFMMIHVPYLRYRLLLMIFTPLLLFGGLEAATRLYMRANPNYEVQVLRPHPNLGWTMVPNTSFEWRGWEPECVSYDVEVSINSLGFRDDDANPSDVLRIGYFGDSFVEALQLPFEQRSAEVLERQLSEAGIENEVFNFGIGNWSVGQSYLAYQEFADEIGGFDLVFMLISDYNLRRIDGHDFEEYSLRPAYEIGEDGELIYYPTEDYESALARFESRINEDGSLPQTPQYLAEPTTDDWADLPLQTLMSHMQIFPFLSFRVSHLSESLLLRFTDFSRADYILFSDPLPDEIQGANLAVLELLAEAVAEDGAQFAVIDDTYSPEIGEKLQAFASAHDAGYVALDERIIEANHNGDSVIFMCDPHYNELGNQIMADAMLDWILENQSEFAATQ